MNQKNLPLLAVCTGFFMVVIDVMIVNIALPTIARDLHANITDLQWVVDGYALTFACFLLFAGYLGDRVGSKTIFLWGLILFVLTSLGCGLSTQLWMLLVFRLFQGFAAALLVPSSLSLIRILYEKPKERAHAIGIWGALGGVAAALGPVLGGVLTAYLGWRSIFLINIPIGLLGIWATAKFIKKTLSDKTLGFDLLGQVVAILCIASLAFGLIEAGRLGWSNLLVQISLIISLLSLFSFLIAEYKVKNPMLPLNFFKSSTFSASMLMGLLLNIYVFGIVFILPLYFQQVKHYSILLTSFAIFPLTAFTFIGSFMGGKLTSAFGARRPILIGCSIGLSGFLLILLLGRQNIAYPVLFVCLIFWGLANSIVMPATTFAIMHSVPSEKTGIASAAFNTSRQIGSLIGVAIFGTMLTTASSFTKGLQIDFIIGAGLCLVALYAAFIGIKQEA